MRPVANFGHAPTVARRGTTTGVAAESPDSGASNVEKPTLLYDGNCEFCRRWVHRWRQKTGNAVEYRPHLGLRFARLIEPGGREFTGAAAILHALGTVGERRWVRALYDHAPGFRIVADFAYAF